MAAGNQGLLARADLVSGSCPARETGASSALTTEQRAFFEENGFIAIPEMVPPAEVARIRSILEDLHDRKVGFSQGAQYDALGADDGNQPAKFPQIMQPRQFAPALIKGAFYERAHAMATELLGEGARLKVDISLMKPAALGPATPWHQDEAYHHPEFDSREISFWLALQPTDQTNGCMSFLPKSHSWPVLEHGHPGGDPTIHALECIGDFDPSLAVTCPLPPGGCTLHTSRTLHYAAPNTSGRTRFGYVLIFDTVPVRRTEPRDFPWQRTSVTARSVREKAWRRRGGVLVHMWRQRDRVRLHPRYVAYDVWRLLAAIRNSYGDRRRIELQQHDQSSPG